MQPTKLALTLGFVLILIGIGIILFSLLNQAKTKDVKYSIVGFIGFIPFGIANDKRLLILSIFFLVFILLFIYFYFFH